MFAESMPYGFSIESTIFTLVVTLGERPKRPATLTSDSLWALIEVCWGERAHRLTAEGIAIRIDGILLNRRA